MPISGNQWQSVAISGNQWQSGSVQSMPAERPRRRPMDSASSAA